MRGHRILVVDDNATNLKLACSVLELAGYAVEGAYDADEALRLIDKAPPQLILMDIGLPGMDGLTLTRKLKSHEKTRQIRIVALTAFAMKGDEQRMLDAGCDGYIAKPIDTRALAGQVAGYLVEHPHRLLAAVENKK
jgi:CheY-like chemotaxis protein